jgi:transcription elongation factor GreA
MAGEPTTTEDITLQQAAHQFLASLKQGAKGNSPEEVLKFVRWTGAERPLSSLRGHEIASYGESIAPTISDASTRADVVRVFLKWAKDRGYTTENLGTHLRIKKPTKSSSGTATVVDEPPVYLTKEGHQDLVNELEELKARRPQIQQDLARAMADKDFRENAPLDAARNEQGHLEARIRELEATLRRAVIIEEHGEAPTGEGARIGDHVSIRDLRTGGERTYTLVNTDEVRAGQGKISIASPVGKAVYQHRAGEEVEVEAPAGTFRVRIESIKSP